MNALKDKHVQFWFVVGLVLLGTVIGTFVGMYVIRDAVVYDYTVEVAAGDGHQVELQYGVWPALANTNFYTEVRDSLIGEQAHFVEANLTEMTLSVYRDGTNVLTVPIKSKGREGSWWETPSGLYKADNKIDIHFSSFGEVYMPYNIPFQGNFFIHGWPYYEDGTPVAEGYSGGCIRLADEYAAQVYELVDVGMPILVFEENQYANDPFRYALNAPELTSASYLVADLDTNFVLMAHTEEEERHVQALAPLMTALVVAEHLNLEKSITVSKSMIRSEGSNILHVGRTYRLFDLLYPLLLESSAEVGYALEAYYGTEWFVSLMNKKARAIGMNDTLFTDVSGVDARNHTTAEDIFMFLKYLRTNRSFILDMTAGVESGNSYGATVFGEATTTHPLYFDHGFQGGIASAEQYTGIPSSDAAAVLLVFATSTQKRVGATQDLVTVLERSFDGGDRHVVFVALDTTQPMHDTRAMLSHVRQLYK